MYCVNCGVQLADTEKTCPLCGVTCFHPEIVRPEVPRTYPADRMPLLQMNARGILLIATALSVFSLIITLVCDLQISGGVTWSGYVAGALVMSYVSLVLPYWFRNPNPVVFVPCGFAALGLYLLYISIVTRGGWFLSLAFPVVGFFCLLTTAVAAVLRYVRRGRLYLFGGAAIALGLFMPLMELLIVTTFSGYHFVGWSVYPLTVLVLFGGFLIFLAICKPAREIMERKFFL